MILFTLIILTAAYLTDVNLRPRIDISDEGIFLWYGKRERKFLKIK